jgi:hypothetical protein
MNIIIVKESNATIVPNITIYYKKAIMFIKIILIVNNYEIMRIR